MIKRRLFLAIKLPPTTIDALERLQNELKRVFPEARVANPAGMHLTVKFIGYAEDTELPRIADAAGRAAGKTQPFLLAISGLGGFPSITRPRVIWAGAQDDGESAALYTKLNKELAGLGIDTETRPFKPHITLARINKPSKTPIEATFQAAAMSEKLGETRADRLVLFESRLLKTGAEYDALEEFSFCLDTNTCL